MQYGQTVSSVGGLQRQFQLLDIAMNKERLLMLTFQPNIAYMRLPLIQKTRKNTM